MNFNGIQLYLFGGIRLVLKAGGGHIPLLVVGAILEGKVELGLLVYAAGLLDLSGEVVLYLLPVGDGDILDAVLGDLDQIVGDLLQVVLHEEPVSYTHLTLPTKA